jgi:hypothetical protein
MEGWPARVSFLGGSERSGSDVHLAPDAAAVLDR